MNITRGRIIAAQKVVIYGPEGIGKSTFASHFPDPLFIDTEGSTKRLDVARLDKPSSWTMLKNQIAFVRDKKPCKTLVIDTIDWAEQLCIDDICALYDKKGIEDFGYGNGYVYEKEEFGRFLNALGELTDCGINVVLTAHAQLRKFSQPDEIGEYDRWELKLGKKTGSQISPLVKEWADMVLFANYKTFAVAVDKDAKKFKAQGGERVMYTTHHPCWDAKNRDGLDEILPFDYQKIAKIIEGENSGEFEKNSNAKRENSKIFEKNSSENVQKSDDEKSKIFENEQKTFENFQKKSENNIYIPDNIPKALADLMRANSVSEEDIRLVVSQKGYMPEDMPISDYPPDFIEQVLVAAWDSVFKAVQELDGVPF